MSTIPVEGFTALPLPRLERRRWGGVRPVSRHVLRRVLADCRNVPRYLVRYAAWALALFGALSLWECCGDGRIPVFTSLVPTQGINPSRLSSLSCAAKGVSDESRWGGLAPALKVLDQVNPQVAAWVRRNHDEGTVAFFDDYRGAGDGRSSLAKYDCLRRRLIVNRLLFCEKDGSMAAILCHEYRHSRQSLPKLLRCAVSFALTKDWDSSVLENEAVLYEQEANFAIFGK
jgi:hypothetical protein